MATKFPYGSEAAQAEIFSHGSEAAQAENRGNGGWVLVGLQGGEEGEPGDVQSSVQELH